MLTAATILAETNGFELFKNYKQLVSYAGLMLLNESQELLQGKQNIKKATVILEEYYLCQPL
jgi:hypothetical protein